MSANTILQLRVKSAETAARAAGSKMRKLERMNAALLREAVILRGALDAISLYAGGILTPKGGETIETDAHWCRMIAKTALDETTKPKQTS